MKECPRCQKLHEKPGKFCSHSCANSRSHSSETLVTRLPGMKVEFSFSVGITLTYKLNGSRTAARWAEKLSKHEASDLNKTGLNHRHGFANYQEIFAKFDHLKELAQQLGLQVTGYDHSDLNKLHVEFAKFHRRRTDKETLKVANELNLVIHWLEYEINMCKLFNLDFNDASEWPAEEIPRNELSYFCTDYTFGDLHLHYVHVGRPFYEMYMNEDRVTPRDQFKPQHYFNATCGLVFRESRTDAEQLRKYFDARGGKAFFGYAYDDPLLANGYFKLGSLEGYEALEDREALRSSLAQAEVTGWKVHG